MKQNLPDILKNISSPKDIKGLKNTELESLCNQIREFLIKNVSKTGGHFGSNLAAIEFTVALHKVFDSPADKIIFDVGHICYTHKLLTGRKDFSNLRKPNGLSGYIEPDKSEHDILGHSHASAALSWACGISQSNKLNGLSDKVIAVIGDGGLTGGLSWEGINNIDSDSNIVIVINDNGKSYNKTIGRFAQSLQFIRLTNNYINLEKSTKSFLNSLNGFGTHTKRFLHGIKHGAKSLLKDDANVFENLGFPYIGPVNGHDINTLVNVFNEVKKYKGAIIVHIITKKGKGFIPAEHDEQNYHSVSKIDNLTGENTTTLTDWTKTFQNTIVDLAHENDKIVGITAAMCEPIGFNKFSKKYPQRFFDTGITESHCVAFAAALATKGFKPFVGMYSTFSLRSYDQVLFDASSHNAPITLILDRAGITGTDDKSHHGIFDLAIFSTIPNIKIATPFSKPSLIKAIKDACKIKDCPSVIRYPKGNFPTNSDMIEEKNTFSVFKKSNNKKLIICFSPLQDYLLNTDATIIFPLWSFPFCDDIIEYAQDFNEIVTVEDGVVIGGLGVNLASKLKNKNIRNIGVKNEFIGMCDRSEFLSNLLKDL